MAGANQDLFYLTVVVSLPAFTWLALRCRRMKFWSGFSKTGNVRCCSIVTSVTAAASGRGILGKKGASGGRRSPPQQESRSRPSPSKASRHCAQSFKRWGRPRARRSAGRSSAALRRPRPGGGCCIPWAPVRFLDKTCPFWRLPELKIAHFLCPDRVQKVHLTHFCLCQMEFLGTRSARF